MWVNKNDKAEVLQSSQESQERIQDKLDNSYEMLIESARSGCSTFENN